MLPKILSDEYLAGLFDGEGCVVTGLHGKGMRARVAICMGNAEDLFLQIQSQFGGSVRQDKRGYWHWQASSQKAVSFLRAIEPFLLVKRNQALLAIELQSGIFPNGGISVSEEEIDRREKLALSIRALNGRSGGHEKP